MDCSACQDLIVPYALAALDATQRQQVRAHLETGCARCAGYLKEIEETLAQLPLSLDPVPPAEHVRNRLLKRLDDERRSAAVNPKVRSTLVPPRRARWAEPLLAGGLAAAIAVAVLWVKIDHQQRDIAELRNEILRQESRVDQLQASLDREGNTIRLFSSPAVQLVLLQGSGDQPAAKGRAFWDRDRDAFHFFASGLKPLPAGKAYELWFINADQKKIPAGTFTVSPRGEASLVATPPAGTGRIAALAVTDEPAGGSSQPTGHIQLSGQPG